MYNSSTFSVGVAGRGAREHTMTALRLGTRIAQKVDRSIIISGCMRSGTTILGRIIYSMRDVEYVLEPPLMYSLFALLPEMEESHWRLLFETHLYEEFLVNALAGRSINTNRSDDSSIFLCKSEDAVAERLSRSMRKKDAVLAAEASTVAFKTPSIVPFLPVLKKYYPGIRIIIVTRGATDIFNSLKGRRWFSDDTLRNEDLLYPNHFNNGLRIPYWVRQADHRRWEAMDELNRIAYYYIRMNEAAQTIPGCITVKYGELLARPRETAAQLAETLGLRFGEKSDEIIASIKPREHKGSDRSILDGLGVEERERVDFFSKMSQ